MNHKEDFQAQQTANAILGLLVVFLVLFLLGCTDKPTEILSNVEVDLKGVPENHYCSELLMGRHKINILACYKFMEHPKYKIGQRVYVETNTRAFKGTIERHIWAHGTEIDKPMYGIDGDYFFESDIKSVLKD